MTSTELYIQVRQVLDYVRSGRRLKMSNPPRLVIPGMKNELSIAVSLELANKVLATNLLIELPKYTIKQRLGWFDAGIENDTEDKIYAMAQ